MDHALRQLREDVWSARGLTAVAGGGLDIAAGEQTVRWRFAAEPRRAFPAGGVLVRRVDGSAEATQRFEVPHPIEVDAIRKHGVTVSIDGKALWLVRAAGWVKATGVRDAAE
jgi:hypothetical protein